jgi:hypothetical protein
MILPHLAAIKRVPAIMDLHLLVDMGRMNAPPNYHEIIASSQAATRVAPIGARMASLIETCKPNLVNPQRYLTDTVTRLARGWSQSRIDELMPWHWAEEQLH